MRKLFLTILLLFSSWNCIFSQFLTNGNRTTPVEMKFFFEKVEAKPDETLFNILIIKNNSENVFFGKIKFTQPSEWNLIGVEEMDIQIPPKDSLSLPIRVSISNSALGEIAYSIVASLYAQDDHPLLSEYCFINIPRVTDLRIKSPKRITYFDNKTNEASFQYEISNQGNTNEIIQLSLTGDEVLSIEDNSLLEPQTYEYIIPAHADTIVELNVKLEGTDIDRNFFKLDINNFTQDSLYKDRIWFNKIDNEYSHIIPEQSKCAIIEITGSNVLSTSKPRYSLLAKGNILLKKNRDLYYFFNKNDLESEFDNYYDTRAYIGIKTKYFDYQVGTVQNIFNESVFGIGNIGQIKYKNYSVNGHYLFNDQIQQTFYGGGINIITKNRINIGFGYSEKLDDLLKNYSQIFMSKISFSFLKKNRLSLRTYLNNTTHAFATSFDKQGFAIFGSYSGNFNRVQVSARVDYGAPDYSGVNKGRFIASSNINYGFDNQDRINLTYNKSDNIGLTYINDVAQPQKKTLSDNFELNYIRRLNKNTNLYFGPIFKKESFNLPYIATDPNIYFNTLDYRFGIALRYNQRSTRTYFKSKIDFGQINVANELEQVPTEITSVLTYNINLYSFFKDFSLYGQYRYGPSGIYSQYLYFTDEYFSRWLVLIPTYNRDFFNHKLNFDLRGNYRNDITNQNKNYSLTTQLQFFLPAFFTLRLLNSISSNSQFDALNNSVIRYNSTYFEVSLRKEFNCKQPRFQYYDLNVVFFKDLNGNRIKEKNEPGLGNVLATIEQDYEIESVTESKDFVSQKLLTGPDGTISYDNIVNGAYRLKYVLIGNMVGNFNREEMEQSFIVDKDKTIYIPYLENNRIVGKVILNRDPLSSMGPIDISNIRVIAEDTKGHTYSALTNRQGNFIIYAPVTDYYIVRINNIFYESFDLQQPEFVVKFNGYKEFEVTFVFDEKKRKINFDTDVTTDDNFVMDDLKAIRKTTLSGKIRDAISLEPVDATIEIIDNKTKKVISSAISNKLNGNYSISYVANENYRIEVKAESYWDHVENLYIEQVISIQNIAKDIMLNKTSEGPKKQTFIIYDEKEEEKFTENFMSGQEIPMNNLNFDEKETRLSPNLYPELDRLIDILEKNKTVRIQVVGHAHDTGKDRIDNLLALRRAKAVARYLTSHGLDESRIEIKSYSNKRPLVPGNSEKAKQKNRRVEIIVL